MRKYGLLREKIFLWSCDHVMINPVSSATETIMYAEI